MWSSICWTPHALPEAGKAPGQASPSTQASPGRAGLPRVSVGRRAPAPFSRHAQWSGVILAVGKEASLGQGPPVWEGSRGAHPEDGPKLPRVNPGFTALTQSSCPTLGLCPPSAHKGFARG